MILFILIQPVWFYKELIILKALILLYYSVFHVISVLVKVQYLRNCHLWFIFPAKRSSVTPELDECGALCRPLPFFLTKCVMLRMSLGVNNYRERDVMFDMIEIKGPSCPLSKMCRVVVTCKHKDQVWIHACGFPLSILVRTQLILIWRFE